MRGVLRLRPPVPFPSHPTPHPTPHAPGLPPTSDHADGRKKKKKKSHASEDRARKEADVAVAAESSKHRERDERSERTRVREDHDERRGSASVSASPAPASSGRRMTDAERRFEDVQRKRREERAKKNAHLTHKERVAQLNARLDSMSEHYDMPRVSWREGRREGSLRPAVMSACGADGRSDQAKSSGMPQGVPLPNSVSPRRACMLSEELVSIGGVDGHLLAVAG